MKGAAYWQGRAERAEAGVVFLVDILERVVSANRATPMRQRREAIAAVIPVSYPREVFQVLDRRVGGDNAEAAEAFDRAHPINPLPKEIALNLDSSAVAAAAHTLQFFCHGQARANGWWTDMLSGADLTSSGYPLHRPTKNVPELLCLVHSELSEAMEGYRKTRMDEHLPLRTALEVELADAVIRLFDMSGGLGLDLAGAIAEKLAFNATRADHTPEARRAVGGKIF